MSKYQQAKGKMEERRKMGCRATLLNLSLTFMWWMILWSATTILKPTECAEATKVVFTRHGPVRGMKIDLSGRRYPSLGKVDTFLGIPYVSAPVGQFRFMPPMSPQPWQTVRDCTEFSPVCPQVIPDFTELGDDRQALRFMTVGRLNYVKKLFTYLRHQSEDCLYLNIYSPSMSDYVSAEEAELLPVMVFIHGESYEWNSGNPYDGSVLAAYGKVVVVTLNYRLGTLGFLRPGLQPSVISNFGLLDQVAAIHWLRENVKQFRGDPNSITLVGHGTGAAMVSLLLSSPVAQASEGLFQRAILMSGTALSPMALSKDPREITLQVIKELNCSSENDTVISNCLKNAKLEDLLNAKIKVPMYTTPYGPIIDGVVIPADPELLMADPGAGNNYPRYDIMFGLTESESFHLFPASTVTYGISAEEQRKIVKTFLKNIFNVDVEQVLTAVMNEYTDYRQTDDENKILNRDTLLSIFSDARIAAPLLKSATIHGEHGNIGNTFLYVFQHVTKYGYYPEAFGSLHGEELAYALGMPLTGGMFHLEQNYTFQEQILSEVMMQYWVNFARTGNASSSSQLHPYVLSSPFSHRMEHIAPSWAPFNRESQNYMALDLETTMKAFYRPHKMALWNLLVPDLVKLAEREMDVAIDKLPHSRFPSATSAGNSETNIVIDGGSSKDKDSSGSSDKDSSPPFTYGGIDVSDGIPISVVIVIGIILLSLNVCACVGVVYQKTRVRQREDNLRRHIHRLSDAGVIHSAQILAENEDTDGIPGSSGGPYCISSSDNFNQNTYGPDPVRNTACTTSDPEDMSDSDDEEQLTDDDLYMMKQPHPNVKSIGGISHSIQHNLHHHPITNQQKVGSLKSALRKPTKSNEMLFQSLPDRSELHRHSKSIPNFNQHDLMNRELEGLPANYRNNEEYNRGAYYNYPSQQQSHYNVPRSIYNPNTRPPTLQHQHSLPYDSQLPPHQNLQLSHQQQPSPFIISSSSNHDTSFSSNRTSLFADSINSSNSLITNDALRAKGSATLNAPPITRNQEMKMYYPSSNAVSGHFSDSAADGSLSIRQQNSRPKLLGLPKVIPDISGACHNLASTAKRKVTSDGGNGDDDSDRIPSPIIEVIPMSEYEPMYPIANRNLPSANSSTTGSLQRTVSSGNNPNLMQQGNYISVSQAHLACQQRPPFLLNPRYNTPSNQLRQPLYSNAQPLYSGAVYPIYQTSGTSNASTLPLNQQTSNSLVPNQQNRSNPHQPKMVAFKSPIASSSPIERKEPSTGKTPATKSNISENIPMIQRGPPQLPPAIEDSCHVPIIPFQQKYNNNPSISSSGTTDVGNTSSNSDKNNDSIYGFLPSNQSKQNDPKKKIEFNLGPDGSAMYSCDNKNQQRSSGILHQRLNDEKVRCRHDSNANNPVNRMNAEEKNDLSGNYNSLPYNASKPLSSNSGTPMRLSTGALMNSTFERGNGDGDENKIEDNTTKFNPNSKKPTTSLISKDVDLNSKTKPYEKETTQPNNERKEKTEEEKNISLNKEQLKATLEGYNGNNSIVQKEFSKEPLRKDPTECKTVESEIQSSPIKQAENCNNGNEANKTCRNVVSDAQKCIDDRNENKDISSSGSNMVENLKSINRDVNVPSNSEKSKDILEENENSTKDTTKNKNSFSLVNKSNSIKRNAPAIVMSLFGKKSTPKKEVARPHEEPKPSKVSDQTKTLTIDESNSSCKNVNSLPNVGSREEDNILNKGEGDENNKEDVNGSGTSSSLIPNVRGPVWQAFVASNSNNNTLTNSGDVGDGSGGSRISDNETNKMPVASSTSKENENGSNKSSKNSMSPLSKNVLGDQIENNKKKCNESNNTATKTSSSMLTDVPFVDDAAAPIGSKCNNSNIGNMSFSTMSAINNNESENEKHVHILTRENITNEKEVAENKKAQLQDNAMYKVGNNIPTSSSLVARNAPIASDEDSASTSNDLSSSTYTSSQTIVNDQDIDDMADMNKLMKPQNESLFPDSNNSKTPVLRKVGEKTPPGTLKRKDSNVIDGPQPSAKSWCTQYSQAFLSKTIDTEDVPLVEDEISANILNNESSQSMEERQLANTIMEKDTLPLSDEPSSNDSKE